MSNISDTYSREQAVDILCTQYNYAPSDFEGSTDLDVFDTLTVMLELKNLPDQA